MSAPTMGLISAVANKGELRWMPRDGAIKAPVLIRLMQRLVLETGCKVSWSWTTCPSTMPT